MESLEEVALLALLPKALPAVPLAVLLQRVPKALLLVVRLVAPKDLESL